MAFSYKCREKGGGCLMPEKKLGTNMLLYTFTQSVKYHLNIFCKLIIPTKRHCQKSVEFPLYIITKIGLRDYLKN